MMSDYRQAPTADEMLDAASLPGARCVRGLPTHAPLRRGGFASLDLAAALRGSPDPWYTHETPIPGVVVVSTACEVGIGVAGLEVGEADSGPALAAISWGTLAASGGRHDDLADAARVAAGRAAAEVTDSMVRARLLDAVDGWSAVLGALVDGPCPDGALHDPSPGLDLTCRLLAVTCPSTGRRYVLRVPAEHRTARAARRWTMGLGAGDELGVET